MSRALWRAILPALLGALAPAAASASLPSWRDSRLLDAELRRETPLPASSEIKAAAPHVHGVFCPHALPKTRVRGFELGLHCSIGGEAGLTCTSRPAYALRYGGHALERSVFTGYLWDKETNLFFAKARFYDPEVGRFISQDSYLGQVDDPPSLHRYFYANDNPTRYVDPTGHFSIEDAKREAKEAAFFAAMTLQHFGDEAGKTYERTVEGVGKLLVPGATAQDRRAAGLELGPMAKRQMELLDAARDPKNQAKTRLYAYGEAAQMQPGVVAEEVGLRPLQEAPGHARAAGVHAEQASRATSIVDKTIHTLEAVAETAQAFLGFATPAAVASGPRGAVGLASDELAVAEQKALRIAGKVEGGTTRSVDDFLAEAQARVARSKAEYRDVTAYGMEGRYEFPDQAAGGTRYVGQSKSISRRLREHEGAGRLQPGTETTTEVLGGKTAREISEHKRIQEVTGGVPASQSDKVSNKVDPIGPKRQHLLEDDPKQ